MFDLETIKARNEKRVRDYIALAKIKAALRDDECPECQGEGKPDCPLCDGDGVIVRPIKATR